MHQSKKEQGLERTSRMLLQPERLEARILAELDTDIEVAAEWGVRSSVVRRAGNGNTNK